MNVPRSNSSQTSKQKEAARLKMLREALGLSMRDLAKEFKVNHASISQWEKGNNTIPGSVIRLIEIYEQNLKKTKGAK